MGITDVLTTTREFVDLLPVLLIKPQPKDTVDSMGLRLEQNAESYGDKPMITFEGQDQTWGEFNALTNRLAHVLKDQGVKKGDCISLLMENRIEQLAVIFAGVKLGAQVGLINTNLRGRPLIHCITVTESSKCIVGEELADAVEDVLPELTLKQGEDFLFVADKGEKDAPTWAMNLAAPMGKASEENPAETHSVTLGDTALYIFTSGTTGLPKAAVLSHNRFLSSAFSAWKTGLKCSQKDRIYLCLPLYHGTGLLIGMGSSLMSGASMFIRRKFSGSRFLDEVREQKTNCFIYIGELCRYLMHQP
ncbi:MAG: AMP-binding protein, partial [Pseudomonadota bacterium]